MLGCQDTIQELISISENIKELNKLTFYTDVLLEFVPTTLYTTTMGLGWIILPTIRDGTPPISFNANTLFTPFSSKAE